MIQVPLLPDEVKGLNALIRLGEQVYGNGQATLAPSGTRAEVAVG
jgi:hypothetical protein